MPGTEKVAQGRLAGAKAQSYLRAVNDPKRAPANSPHVSC
jgi:hypothetical protein